MSSPFKSIQIGSIEIPNRIAMAPMKTAYGTTSWQVTEQLVAYFHRRADGGVGLIISEPLYVERYGICSEGCSRRPWMIRDYIWFNETVISKKNDSGIIASDFLHLRLTGFRLR